MLLRNDIGYRAISTLVIWDKTTNWELLKFNNMNELVVRVSCNQTPFT